MHECRTSKYHDTCKSNVDQETPLRLIDVGKEGDRHVTLSQDHGVVDYVALSYCWGGPQDVVLTAEDVEQAVFAFEYWTLPATIQDAITITRKLGISYLWIDALCIIQRGDDGKDFAFQGPKMDSIYGSAYITIAAAGTSSVNDGFLNSHKIQGSKYYVATVPYELVSKERGTIMFSTRNRKREYEAEPLLSRCWTLQERILSPRVLSFHSDHLTWNCRNSHHSSDGLFWPVTDLDYLLPSIIPFEFFMHVDKPTTKIPEFWRLCVEDYSNRFRSVETDKLVALAGVARRIHKQTGDVYLAGLWKSDIMKQLCWSTDNECNQSFVRPSRYLAPSWSWVSLDSKINVAKFIDNDFYWRAHLVDVKTILFDESSPFAEVTDGWLVLRGQVKQARTMDKHGNWVPMSFSNDNARRAAESNATTSIRSYLSSIMDGGCAVDTRQFCELYWLWLFSDQSKTFLLLLEPTPQETIFIRVGWIELKVGEVDFEWFDDAETQDITIL